MKLYPIWLNCQSGPSSRPSTSPDAETYSTVSSLMWWKTTIVGSSLLSLRIRGVRWGWFIWKSHEGAKSKFVWRHGAAVWNWWNDGRCYREGHHCPAHHTSLLPLDEQWPDQIDQEVNIACINNVKMGTYNVQYNSGRLPFTAVNAVCSIGVTWPSVEFFLPSAPFLAYIGCVPT